MIKSRLTNLIFTLSMIFLLVFSIGPIFAEDEIIQSMNDLNCINEDSSIAQSSSLQSSNLKAEILILYNTETSNNLGSLGLMKKDFESGKTINDRLDILKTSGNTPVEDLIENIQDNPNVKSADYNRKVYALDINDYYYEKYQKETFDQLNNFKTVTLGMENLVKVAVLDTGLNTSHEDIQGNFLLEGFNALNKTNDISDDNGHGTAVSGIISAITNNGIGLTGLSGTNNIKIVPYKCLDNTGSGGISKIVDALMDINKKDDIRVINLSLGMDKESPVLEEVLQESYDLGKIVIASAGNDGGSHILFPARYNQVISVGSVNQYNNRCTSEDWGSGHGSNFGVGLDFVAPGDNIAVLNCVGDYSFNSGTSYSSPIVAALVALLIEKNPNLTINEIISDLKSQAVDLGPSGYDIQYGYGIINFDDSLDSIYQKPTVPSNPDVRTLELKPTSLNMTVKQISKINVITNSLEPIVWTSSNPDVLSVRNGLITALKPGQAKIRASFTENDIYAETLVNISNVDILSISSHSQDIGWLPSVKSLEIAGTTGKHKQLEAFRISVADPDISIDSQAHISEIGDTGLIGENGLVGTTGKALGIEAINLNISGPNAQYYDLYYRTHVENYGWTKWSKANKWAGTKGKNLQLEAIQLEVVPRGTQPPNIDGDVNWCFMS